MMSSFHAIYLLFFTTIASTDVTPVSNKEDFREKVLYILNQRGKASFDSSITDELAEQLYNRHENHDPSKPISMGTSKPFKINRDIPSTHRFAKKYNNNNEAINERRRGLTSTGWEESDKQLTLDIHNGYRDDIDSTSDDGTDGTYPSASDMNYMFWDDALASVAQAYSDKCDYGHNSNRNDEFYDYTNEASFVYPDSDIYLGENIAVSYTTSNTISIDYLTDKIDAWWEEYSDWHYQTYSSGTINGAGHFTQMAWANTRYLGCGFSYCVDGGYNMYYLVCNYYPGGNYVGQYPYASGTCSADTCDGDRTVTCDDNLCGGCMDSSYVQTGSTTSSTDCSDGFVDVTNGNSGSGSGNNGNQTDIDVTPSPSGAFVDKRFGVSIIVTIIMVFIHQIFY